MASTSEIHISGTADDSSVGAQAVLRDRDDELCAELAAKVALATELRLSPVDGAQARVRLVTFCAQRLLRHLTVTDQVLYGVAAGAAETRLLVRALRELHRFLGAEIGALDQAQSNDEVIAVAHGLVAVLESCLQIKHLILVPAVAALSGVDLAMLVADIDVLLRGGAPRTPEVLDVREIPHGRRHPRIFGVYSRLVPGESFVLVNNHDPKPLRREFEATYPDQFEWEYLQSGPNEWRVRIGRHSVHA